MGVHGLWKLIEPSGKVVPLDTLEGKVLAVDISIWLHQAIKGYQDAKGSPIPNAHLLTIYNRVCKLLYFRIKPVFVFDGGVPALKKETIAKRNQLKSKNQSEAQKIQKQLLNTLLKHSAVTKVLSEKTRAELGAQVKKITTKNDKSDNSNDLFILPPSQTTYESSDSYDEESFDDPSGTSDSSPTKYFNIHDLDEKSVQFKNLPADVRHEILTDLKETRKQNSWGRIHELPKQSDDFSSYQMKRLLKRYSIQTCLEEAEKEMGGASLSLNELESLLNDHGVITENKGNRIASDENTRYLYIKDVKKALENTKKKELQEIEEKQLEENKNDEIFQKDLEDAIKLSQISEENAENSIQLNENVDKICNQSDIDQNQIEIHPETLKNQLKTSEFDEDLEKAIKLSLNVENPEENHEYTEISLTNDKEYQENLKEAIKLSLQEVPSTSKEFSEPENSQKSQNSEKSEKSQNSEEKNEISSSDTTPMSSQDILSSSQEITSSQDLNPTQNANPDLEFSTYLESLRDSDFNSSEEEGNLDDSLKEGQKAADKIFSAARNYMMEYGGLTQAGVAEIFGQKDESNKQANQKTKLRFNSNTASAVYSSENEIVKDDEVGVMSQSESSDDDFIEVSSENNDKNTNQSNTIEILNVANKKTENIGLQIQFNTKDELVDDIFSDIFQSEASTSKRTLVIDEKSNSSDNIKDKTCKSSEISPQTLEKVQNSLIDTSLEQIALDEDVNTQKAIEESLQSKKPSLIQELIAEKPSSSSQTQKVTVDDLIQLKTTLNQASKDLISDRGAKERLSGNISEQMYHEAQDLLSLFGIPYIIAPMEAEAQCAFLNEINLTDGTITDDSDIWLFGGRTVYKNFFNHDKQVLEFRAESIHDHFKLSRHQLISLAMLVGSDYTTGIQGIGPVTALEVLAAFPPRSDYEIIASLEKFKNWFTTGKKVYGRGKAFLRNKLKNIELHDGFPSSSVLKAYLEPTVETSKETFTWGKPRVEALMNFTREKFGWNAKKVNDTLEPVLKRLSDNTAQKRIQDYFKTVYKAPLNTSMEIQDKLSKRVRKALGTIRQKVDNDDFLVSSSDEDINMEEKDADDLEALNVLKKTKKLSKQKNKSMQHEVEKQLKILNKKDLKEGSSSKDEVEVKKPRLMNLHKKEIIPQKQLAKTNQLQNRMKAIEVFRKSTKGPGFVKKRAKLVRKPKEDAELSESDSN